MQIRRTLTFFDEVAIEAEQQVSQPLRKAWISSFTKRAPPGATIDIPLARKDALYIRSHYDGITVTLPDAPLPDKIAIICAYAKCGRPNHRVGGLAVDQIKGMDGLT
jgi:hypothetical protein